jgi:uncharacterized membrane protein
MNRLNPETRRGFPKIAGIFLGLGLGGFFDGIILHRCCSGIICLSVRAFLLTH